jgi:hypothetical protein
MTEVKTSGSGTIMSAGIGLLGSQEMIWRTDRRWKEPGRKLRHGNDFLGMMCQFLLDLRRKSAMKTIRLVFCAHDT